MPIVTVMSALECAGAAMESWTYSKAVKGNKMQKWHVWTKDFSFESKGSRYGFLPINPTRNDIIELLEWQDRNVKVVIDLPHDSIDILNGDEVVAHLFKIT